MLTVHGSHNPGENLDICEGVKIEKNQFFPFKTEKKFEQPLKCSGVLLIPISWFSWDGPCVYRCSTIAETHKSVTTKESLPFSDIMLVPPGSLFS